MQQDESCEVLIRVTVRRHRDGAQIGSAAIGGFDIERPIKPAKLGEAALEAAKLAAIGRWTGSAAIISRAKVAVRDFARTEVVRRGVAIAAAALRTGAERIEQEAAEAAARIINQAPNPEGDE